MRLLRGLLVALALLMPAAAFADDRPQQEPWHESLAKSIIYGGVSSALETGAFLLFFGGGAAMAGTIFTASAASAAIIAAGHEVAWSLLRDPAIAGDDPALIASKATTLRVANGVRSFALGSILGGATAAVSALYAGTLSIADSALFISVELGFADRQPQPR